jgi:hypothetical protein
VGRVGFTLVHIRKNLDFRFLNVEFGYNTTSGHSSQMSSDILDLIDEHLVKRQFFSDDRILLPAAWLRSRHTPTPFREANPHVVAVVDDTYALVQKHTKNLELGPLIRSYSQKNAHFNLPIATTPDGHLLTCGCALWRSDQQGNAALWYLLQNRGLGEFLKEVREGMLADGEIKEDEKVLLVLDNGYDEQCIPTKYRDIIGVVTPDWGAHPSGVLSSIEANKTRRVTRFRNVIEHFHRRMKEVCFLIFVLVSFHTSTVMSPLRRSARDVMLSSSCLSSHSIFGSSRLLET